MANTSTKRQRGRNPLPGTYDARDYSALMRTGFMNQFVGEPIDGGRLVLDSEEDAGAFFAAELDYLRARTYDKLYPEFTALSIFPQTSEVNPGAETHTYHSYEKIGLAKIIANYATDLPRVDIKGKPTTANIKTLGDSYGYNIQEMRSSAYAGKGLDGRRADSARYAIERERNRVAWAGDEDHGLIGVLSLNNDVPIFIPPNNAAGTSTKWADKSPGECLRDVGMFVEYVATLTKSVEKPNVLALPTDAYLRISTMPRSDASDMSPMQWIIQNTPRLDRIIEAPELNSDSEITPYPGQGVGLMFTDNADKFSIETPLPLVMHPVQAKGLEFEIPCEARVAGAVIYYPMSMLIILGI